MTLCAAQKIARRVDEGDQRFPRVVVLQLKLAIRLAIQRVAVHLHPCNLPDEGSQLRFAHESTC